MSPQPTCDEVRNRQHLWRTDNTWLFPSTGDLERVEEESWEQRGMNGTGRGWEWLSE